MDFHRGRRLRMTVGIRDLVRETSLSANDLMMPYFVAETDDSGFEKPISSMPGQSQLSIPKLVERVKEQADRGLKSLILFGIPAEKDESGSQAHAELGVVQRAVTEIKRAVPQMVVATDVCLCEYTSHGHCGVVRNGEIDNDETITILAQSALSHANAGADMVAPSDMMDGRVGLIRETLDNAGFANLPIMSYAVKYASSFYGPFREAAEGAPAFGDRKSHQMDPGNYREALREAAADLAEGADIIMVKPAGPYLDILKSLRETFDAPLAAYQVSGEYSMIKAAGQLGWMDETATMLESVLAIKRAGADIILTYFAEDLLGHLG